MKPTRFIIRLKKALRHWFWRTLTLSILCIALLLVSAQLLMRGLIHSDYVQQQVRAKLDEMQLPQATFVLDWHGVWPVVRLQHVQWHFDNSGVLSLPSMDVAFSLWQYIQTKTWEPVWISIDNALVTFPAQALKQLVNEQINAQDKDALFQPFAILANLPKIRIRNSMVQVGNEFSWTIDGRFSQDKQKNHVQLHLQNDRHDATDLTIKYVGQLQQPEDAQALINLHSSDATLVAFASYLLPEQYDLALDIQDINIDAQLNWQQKQWQLINTEFDLNGIEVNKRDLSNAWSAGELKGAVQWHIQDKDHARLYIKDIALTPEQRDAEEPVTLAEDVVVDFLQQNDLHTWTAQLKATQLRSMGWLDLLAIWAPLPVTTADFIKQAQPDLWFSEISAQFAPATAQNQGFDWRLNTQVKNISWLTTQNIPGVTHLAGALEGNASGEGTFYINSTNASIDAEQTLGIEPMDELTITGALSWALDKTWLVNLQGFNIKSPSFVASGEMLLQDIGKESPTIDLQLDFNNMAMSEVKYYLPKKVLPERSYAWLYGAFDKGMIQQGHVILRGLLQDFPYDQAPGQFEATADVVNADLYFAPGWPKVEQIDGHAQFISNKMIIHSSKAVLMNNPMTGIEVTIPQMGGSQIKETLTVKGQTQTDAQMATTFLKNTPLWLDLQSDLEPLNMNGNVLVNVYFELPLQVNVPLQTLEGSVQTNGLQLKVPNIGLQFENLDGMVKFTQDGLSSDHLTATYLGHRANFQLNTVRPDPKTRYLSVNAAGSVALSVLKNYDPDFNIPEVDGQLAYQATLNYYHKPSETQPIAQLKVNSDLNGVNINFPAPLAKAKTQLAPTVLNWIWYHNNTMQLSLQYADQLAVTLAAKQKQWRQIALRLGSKTLPDLPKQEGIWVDGRLSSLDVDVWRAYAQKNKKTQTNATSSLPLSMNVNIGHLNVAGFDFTNSQWQVSSDNLGWKIDVKGDATSGTARIPQAKNINQQTSRQQAWQFDLQRCIMPSSDNNTSKKITETIDPTTLPSIQFRCQDFRSGKKMLGDINLVLDAIPQGVNVKTLTLKHPQYQLNATGQWILAQGKQQTSIKGTLETKDVGKALSAWDLRSDLSQSAGRVPFDLYWMEQPNKVDWPLLNGSFSVDLKNGRIVDANPGVGRVFSLFSLDTLQRRLTLDFSDLFKKGFSFDYLKGGFLVNKGEAVTKNTEMDGPAAGIRIEGATNFGTEQMDIYLTVTPHLSSSLPIAAAIATANPAVGAAVWFADKLLSSPLNKIAQYRYHVTGSWKDPNMKRE